MIRLFMILYWFLLNLFSDHSLQKHVNNPCGVGNTDIWTFERIKESDIDMNYYGNIKKLTDYETASGCCKKFSPVLERNKLYLIMDLMKHSLGVPLPDNRLNKRLKEFSLLWPAEDLVQKVEKR